MRLIALFVALLAGCNSPAPRISTTITAGYRQPAQVGLTIDWNH